MIPHYQTEHVTVYHGDSLNVLPQLSADSVDSIVTDPPYGLEFMGKEWDAPWKHGFGETGYTDGKRMARGSTRNPMCRTCRRHQRGTKRCACAAPDFDERPADSNAAFQSWCQLWATECLRVLKPGGHMLAFGGSRTHHRLACAIEDAGFEIRDTIAWLYGAGFPKSLDVSKAIDKRPGVTRHAEFGAELKAARLAAGYTNSFDVAAQVTGRRTGAVANWEKYQFPEAKWWPALRDLLDMDGDKWDAIIAEADREITGMHTSETTPPTAARTGHIWERRDEATTDAAKHWQGWGTALKPAHEPIVVARKPLCGTVAQNVQQYGAGALNIDACRVGTDGGARSDGDGIRHESQPGAIGSYQSSQLVPGLGRWPPNVVIDERTATQIDQQSGNLTSGANPTRRGSDKFRNAYGEFAGQEECIAHRGTDSGGASRFFPTFRYEAKAPTLERPNHNGTAHPTVKPLDLMRWLIRLVTPPHGLVLDPFAGSGTTAEAAIHEHMRAIVIEQEADYLPVITARIHKPMQVGFDFDEEEIIF